MTRHPLSPRTLSANLSGDRWRKEPCLRKQKQRSSSLMSPRWRVLKELGLTWLVSSAHACSLAMEARDCEVARGQPRPIPADARTLRVIEGCDWDSWVGDFVAHHAPEPGGEGSKSTSGTGCETVLSSMSQSSVFAPTLKPKPLNPTPQTLKPKPCTLNPKLNKP